MFPCAPDTRELEEQNACWIYEKTAAAVTPSGVAVSTNLVYFYYFSIWEKF